MSRPHVLGAVLVGGRGTRFGGPKAGATVGGVSMAERVAGAVSAVVDRTVLVGAAGPPDLGLEAVADRTPGAGPLGGLEAALAAAEGGSFDAVLLVACDLPLLEAEPLRRLVDALGEARAAAPARTDGGPGVETACSVWRIDVLDAAREALGGDDRSLQALFRAVGGRALEPGALGLETDRHLLNVNRREDVARAEAHLGQ